MKPILSHTTALEFWRSVRVGTRSFDALDDARFLLDVPPVKSSLDKPGPWWLDRPLHVLVSDSSTRRSSSDIACHTQASALPPRSILDSQNGFCVCCPELCFVQMAATLTLPKLVELGYELCGTYDASGTTLRRCAPLTSGERIASFIERAGRLNGKAAATRALRYAMDASASPRETILAMLLSLPYSLGGYGIPAPTLNHRIDLDQRGQRIAGRGYLVCDLYWPQAKLDVEYDGGDHESAERMQKDSMRRDALISRGITVVTVTKWQLDDGGELNGIAHMIAERLGKRLRYKDPAFTQKHIALREELLGRSR